MKSAAGITILNTSLSKLNLTKMIYHGKAEI